MEAAVDRGETVGGRFHSGIFVGGGWFDQECVSSIPVIVGNSIRLASEVESGDALG